MSEEDQDVQEQVRALMRRLRDERLARGMTQGDVAEAIGVSRQRVQQWERCKPGASPKIEGLERLASALGYRVVMDLEPSEAHDE